MISILITTCILQKKKIRKCRGIRKQEMKIEDLEAKIKARKEYAGKLEQRMLDTPATEHARAISSTLTEIREEIKDMEKQIAELKKEEEIEQRLAEQEKIGSNDLVNGDIVRSFSMNPQKASPEVHKKGKRTLATFKTGIDSGYNTTEQTNGGSIGGLALRSDETLVSRLEQAERKPLDLGKYVRGAITGNWNNAQEERAAFTTSTTGVIIPQALSARVIDLSRNVSLFASAGVPLVPMDTDNMTIARVKEDPQFKFKQELAEADEAGFTLDSVKLETKTAYGYAYCSLEAIRSAKNLTDILGRVFSQALAKACDYGMLYGQNGDTFAPSGIMNDTAINKIEATNRYYSDFIRAIGAIKRANGNPTVVGMNAATEEELALMTDANGNIMEEPKAFADLSKVISNQLIEDAENGSDALVFDPYAMVIGIQNQLTFRIIQDTDYCIKHGAIGFQIYSMLDCIATQPKHITKITGLKAA